MGSLDIAQPRPNAVHPREGCLHRATGHRGAHLSFRTPRLVDDRRHHRRELVRRQTAPHAGTKAFGNEQVGFRIQHAQHAPLVGDAQIVRCSLEVSKFRQGLAHPVELTSDAVRSGGNASIQFPYLALCTEITLRPTGMGFAFFTTVTGMSPQPRSHVRDFVAGLSDGPLRRACAPSRFITCRFCYRDSPLSQIALHAGVLRREMARNFDATHNI